MSRQFLRCRKALLAGLFAIPLLYGCGGKGSSSTAPSVSSSPSVDGLSFVRLWPNNVITYRVEGNDSGLRTVTKETAEWWNSKLGGVVRLIDSGGGEPNIYVQLGELRPGECGRTGHTSRVPPSGLDIIISPICGINIFTVAHEFGHALGINGHACRGVMAGRSDCPTLQPIATALADTEPSLFEAVKAIYR